MNADQIRSAYTFLTEKCGFPFPPPKKGDTTWTPPELQLALNVRRVMEEHRGIRNVQFSDSSTLLQAWMPIFVKSVSGILTGFVNTVFYILKKKIASPGLRALSAKFNGMLAAAETGVLRPKVLQVLSEYEQRAKDFCEDVLSWNVGTLQFTSNEHYLTESGGLTKSEEECLEKQSDKARFELEPLLNEAGQVRGFWKVQAKLLPDALQNQVVMIAERAVKGLRGEIDKVSEEALKVVQESAHIAQERERQRQRLEDITRALDIVMSIETLDVPSAGGPALSFGEEETDESAAAADDAEAPDPRGSKRARQSEERSQSSEVAGGGKKPKTKEGKDNEQPGNAQSEAARDEGMGDDEDTLELNVRLPDFEAKATRMQKDGFVESPPFVFQDHRFFLEVYPQGDSHARDGQASVYLCRKDECKGTLHYNVELCNGESTMSDTWDLDESYGWGEENFCSSEALMFAARATERGALEFRVKLSAPKSNREGS
uniref:MATH domain-containing protein n=1 Tax=Chromera velia CCMP2878 TaxID=1169474 RepID=A0A0G4I629_9ALVE|eukprot:Cvel_11284.t1-p1 / transcript=Cvel_11284.t1 / gene=Cvel_11284 / organism=Chromera_velia_CCMP2878 / gene_product=hypothetical protein / transcript_product=hypothetical protein / location=Cvel_scaffold704:34918-37112(+) / protein_length=487 / sequence_SO=supercontig / SO=protein_coding / is_pseudo=false